MKKLVKMLALGLAAALVFGMAVQAAPSTSTGASMEEVTGVEFKAATEGELAAAQEAVGTSLGGSVVDAFWMNVTDDFEAGTVVTVRVSGVSRGDACYAYKYADDDTTFSNVLAKIALSAGEGTVSFAPVDGCVYLIVNTGKASAPAGSETAPAAPAGGSAASSPKTGEAAPVAGVMALVLMAGAVICAGKARYNR